MQLETAVPGLPAAASSSRAVSRPASVPARLAVRFVTAYLVLYNLPFPLNAVPDSYFDRFTGFYSNFWQAVTSFVASRFFSIQLTVFENGSGDTTYNFVQVFCLLILAGLVTGGWTLAFRNRTEPDGLRRWIWGYLSFSLAFEMAAYGAVKIFPGQFLPPTLDRLLQPIGNTSPMGLLWTFMGASQGFTILSGAMEMLGGILLVIRRTRLLGALVSIVVLTVVFAMNLSYDVPVKLFSGHLLFMAICIAMPNFRRLVDFFILNRTVEAEPPPPPIAHPKIRRTVLAVNLLFAGWVLGMPLVESYIDTVIDRDRLSPSPLYGVWQVDELQVDPADGKPLAPDAFRWKRVIFDKSYFFAVQSQDDGREMFFSEFDLEKRTINFLRRESPKEQFSLTYEENGTGELKLVGSVDGVSIQARLHRMPVPAFRLTSRGFHLINEHPFNK